MYEPIKLCRALEWASAQVGTNPPAATCGLDPLLEAMPEEARADWDDDQMAVFAFLYRNPAMLAVIIKNWWPTYAVVKLLEDFPQIAAEDNPWG